VRHVILILVVLAVVWSGCQKVEQTPAETVSDLDVLASWLTGSFSSAEQAASDSNFYDIRLQVVPVWTDLTDGHWLYVEQAAASALDKPYRQRIYHLTQPDDSTFESTVYTMDDPMRFAGKYSEAGFLGALTPDSLTVREGCSILLRRHCANMFVGSTVDQNCTSNLRGATYATSEVDIREDRVISWDRGFDADGNQVWGAETGGYVFMRVEPAEVDTALATP
jgi:hypothetical protein